MRPMSTTGHSTRPATSASRRGVLDHFETGGEGLVRRVLPDGVGAFLGRQDDAGAFQPGLVVVEGGHAEPAGGHEAVALGGVGGCDAVDVERDDLGTVLAGQDAEDRAERADPAERAVAPAHRLRPGERADGGFEHLGHDHGGGAAGAGDLGDVDLSLPVFGDGQLVLRQPGGAQETGERLFGGIDAGALALLGGGGALLGQAVEREGQAARGAMGDGPGVGQAGLDQAVGHELLADPRRRGAASGPGSPRRRVR